jgi:hypothetical protein
LKRKLYTYSHDVELLKSFDNDGGRFTAEELEQVVKKEQSKTVFKTRENLIRHYSKSILEPRFSFLVDFIKESDFHNILSLGAGPCVNEYFLKMALPEKTNVVACDFDSFYIQKAQEFFYKGAGGGGGGKFLGGLFFFKV